MNVVKEIGTCEKNPILNTEPVTYESMANKLNVAGLSVELVSDSLDNHVDYFIKPV